MEAFRMLDNTVELHSHQTIARDIQDMYYQSQRVIALHLQSLKCQIHIGLDGWASPNVFSYLGVTVKYVEKGVLRGHILDFVR